MKGSSNDTKVLSKYQDLMKDLDFDPFGSFTISELKTASNDRIKINCRSE